MYIRRCTCTWVCGESWLATKDLQPTAPVLKAGHPGVLFFVVGLFSGCLLVCFVVARLFVWVGGWGFFPFYFHCLLAGVYALVHSCTYYVLYTVRS